MDDIKLKDLIYIVPNLLTKEECESVIKEYDNRSFESFSESAYNPKENKVTTSSFMRIELLPSTPNFKLIHTKTESMIEGWMKHLHSYNAFSLRQLKASLRFSHLHRVLKYNIGQSIDPHVDWDEMVHASCTIALNDGYEGGSFNFWNGRHSIKLNQGDAAIWPADPFWVHEVTPITKGVRYSTNSFIQSLPINECRSISKQIWEMAARVQNEFYYKQCEKSFGENNGT